MMLPRQPEVAVKPKKTSTSTEPGPAPVVVSASKLKVGQEMQWVLAELLSGWGRGWGWGVSRGGYEGAEAVHSGSSLNMLLLFYFQEGSSRSNSVFMFSLSYI